MRNLGCLYIPQCPCLQTGMITALWDGRQKGEQQGKCSEPIPPPLAVHQTSFVLILIPQVPSEANPINMVAKLSQLTSLLSSIEDKVLTDPPASLAFVCSPVFASRMSKSPVLHSYDSLTHHCCPQVKALLHEGPESPNRRSLIPPVTFEVSDPRGVEPDLQIYPWGLPWYL